MEFHRRHIKILLAKILDSQALKFQRYIMRKVDQQGKLQIEVLKCMLT
jgi:hypothetical protein